MLNGRATHNNYSISGVQSERQGWEAVYQSGLKPRRSSGGDSGGRSFLPVALDISRGGGGNGSDPALPSPNNKMRAAANITNLTRHGHDVLSL